MKQPTPPKYLNMHKVFLQAIDELAKPYPSIEIDGWNIWNKLTGGFRPREYSILCGTTGAGKTQLLATLSTQLIRQKVKHFVMSVETGHTDFMKRILSCLEGKDLNRGEAVPAKELEIILTKHQELLSENFIEFSLYEDRVSSEQLISDLTFMRKEKGCQIAFIDNFNFFMEPTRAVDVNLEMDRVTHELIIFCKKTDMHVVMVMHPRKTDGTRVLSEYDVKGSSTAIQEAHNVFLFNRPSVEDLRANRLQPTDRELKIAKMRRRGNFVGCTIYLKNINSVYLEKGEWK